MNNTKNLNSKNIARGGIFTALGILFLYLSTVISINKLFLLGLSSCIIPLSILTTSIKTSLIVYGATSLLSLFILPSKGVAIAYIIIFGLYGFLKYYIETLKNAPLEIFLKLVFFNLSSFVIYTLYKYLFTEMVSSKLPVYAIVLLFQLIFIVFDYALTVFINYCNTNLVPKLKSK